MDAFVGLLDGPRARGAFVLRSVMSPSWSLRVVDEAPLTLFAIVKGEAWIAPDRGEPVRLGPGDVAVARGPDQASAAVLWTASPWRRRCRSACGHGATIPTAPP